MRHEHLRALPWREVLCEEPTHTVAPDWWRAYAHLAPALDEASSDDGEEDEDGDDAASTADALAAMEID